MMGSARLFAAELLGTFFLTFLGVGAVLHEHATHAVGVTGIAFAHGIGILIGIYAFGHISGGHFNPAVTFGFLMAGRIRPRGAVLYWAAQIAGAILAAWILSVAYRGPTDARLGAPSVDPALGTAMATVIEAVAAFILVLVVFGSAVDPRAPRGFAGLAIGLTVAANILMAGALTGAAFNPARAFGPSLIAGTWQDQWVYWVGPLLGGGVAAILYDRLFLERARA